MRSLRAILAFLSLLALPAPAAAADPADLRLEKRDEPDPVQAGAMLRYVVRVTNDGPDPATGVVLSDTLPPGVVFHDVQTTHGSCAPAGPEVTCQFGSLSPGATAVVTIRVVPTQEGTIDNTASVSSSRPDPDPTDNAETEPTKVNGPSCTRFGTRSADTIVGTPGADVLCGAGGDDVLVPGEGSDVVMGGPGSDTVSYSSSDGGVRVDLGAGEATGQGPDRLIGVENVVGSAHPDVLLGSAGQNRLVGGGGTDVLNGRAGPDRLAGGGGGDFLNGGKGADVLDGGRGNDVCVNGTRRSCFPASPPDPNDTGGILDVRRVRTNLGSRRPSWTVLTRSTWSLNRLWDDGYVLVYLDTKGTQDPEYYALARSIGSGMRGELFRERGGIDRRIGAVRVRHPSARSVLIRVPLGGLDVASGRTYYRWSVQTILINGPCPTGCFDRVPGRGSLPQPL